MRKIAIAVAFAGLLAACGQQATADLAVCKSDLARVQAEATAAKAAADLKITTLEQAQAALQAKVTEFETAAAAAAEAAAAKAGAAKAKSTAKVTEAKAVQKAAVQQGATAAPQQIQQITDPAAKAKAKR